MNPERCHRDRLAFLSDKAPLTICRWIDCASRTLRQACQEVCLTTTRVTEAVWEAVQAGPNFLPAGHAIAPGMLKSAFGFIQMIHWADFTVMSLLK